MNSPQLSMPVWAPAPTPARKQTCIGCGRPIFTMVVYRNVCRYCIERRRRTP